jgi:hypothetical protein
VTCELLSALGRGGLADCRPVLSLLVLAAFVVFTSFSSPDEEDVSSSRGFSFGSKFFVLKFFLTKPLAFSNLVP